MKRKGRHRAALESPVGSPVLHHRAGAGFRAGGHLAEDDHAEHFVLGHVLGAGVPHDLEGWGIAIVLGVVITGLAYVLFLTALQTVPPFVATITTLLEPLLGAVLGAIVFGERLGVLGVIGGALMGAAVLLLRPQRDEPETIH